MTQERKTRRGRKRASAGAPQAPKPCSDGTSRVRSAPVPWFLRGWCVLPALWVLVGVAYWPTLHADFVQWDDQFYVTENRLLHEPGGLRVIWNPAARDAPQFYPLVFTTYWIEKRLWGDDPRGYHAVNVALHAATTSLVFLVLRAWRFSAPWAAFASAVFAVHPVQVASVAWISERKNTLAGFFLMLSLALYWRAWRHESTPALVASFLTFTASLLSKTQGMALPLAFALTEWAGRTVAGTQLRALRWAEAAARLLPFATIAAVLALVTMQYEHDRWPPLALSAAERLLIAGNALAFYVKSTIWPVHRCPIYPKWTIDPSDLSWWIAPASVAVAAAAAIAGRNRLHPWAVWGVVYFVLGLIPVLGFVPFNFFTYSFVADHFLYFSMFGAAVTLAVGGQALARRFPLAVSFAALAAIAVFAASSYHEAQQWRDNETFWRHVRGCDPRGFLANYNLGLHFSRRGDWGQAAAYYREAALARPRAEFVFRRYADALRAAQGHRAVIVMCDDWLKRTPGFLPAYWERAWSWEQLGDWTQARREYEHIVKLGGPGSPWSAQASQRLATLPASDSSHE